MLKFNRFLSESAYNVGHSSSDDADIQKLISFLQGGNKDDLVMVSTGDLKKYKIKRSFEDDEKKIKDFVKDNELNIPLQDRINRAIAVVAERMKLAYVVEATTLLYSAGGEDITDKVIVVLLALDAKEAGADGASN